MYKTLLIRLTFAGLLVCGAIAAYCAYWYSHPLQEHADGRPFIVKKGWTLRRIADELSSEGLISHPELFIQAGRLYGVNQSLKAGEYQLSASLTPARIIAMLKRGEIEYHTITIPEGVTVQEILRILNESPHLTGTITSVPAEGSLMPETYTVSGEEREEVLKQMTVAMTAYVDQAWKACAPSCPLPSSQAALTLASIVEKETRLDEERPVVAAVFLNRLKTGMPLQADPTVIYGLTQGKERLGRALTLDDLKSKTPYNTYVNKDLPPGPITNPGKKSIDAVLKPATTEYLYFVANGKGGHMFAATLKEHQKNHEAWRKIRSEIEVLKK